MGRMKKVLTASLCLLTISAAMPAYADTNSDPVERPKHTPRATPAPKPTPAPSYTLRDLTSDGTVRATVVDHHLINPWGMAFAPGTFIWLSDNNAGVSTLYGATGHVEPLVVRIPLPLGKKGLSAPTGIVVNANGATFGGGLFIFDTEDGTISRWSEADGTSAVLEVNNAGKAVYKGLALGSNAGGDLLFATNIFAGTVDVFDKDFNQVTVPGNFDDPTIPSGFAPFGVANINGDLYVSYALQDATKENDQPGPGNGFVDIFDTNGNLIRRLISNGPLNSPWGMALAPSNFGPLSNKLLVGNFGDGAINAFDPDTGLLVGQPRDSKGMPIVVNGLWSLVFGDGSDGRPRNSLYFSAGPSHENHGVFGEVRLRSDPPKKKVAAPTPAPWFGY
jgi:uncharacterized protein (TIGR03118 family)